MKRSMAWFASVAILVVGCQAAASPSPRTPSASGSPGATAPGSAPPAATPSGAVTSPAPVGSGRWVELDVDVEPDHARVALGDGRVLVVGNSVPESGPRSAVAQLWDPTTGEIAETAALPGYREQFVALTLADGRALVTGGLNDKNQSFSSTYIYDPATESWSKSGLLGTARTAAVGALLNDGRVLVAGGYYTNGKGPGDEMGAGRVTLAAFHADPADIDLPDYAAALATAEIFDPSTGTWTPTGPMTYARSHAQVVTLADGRVLVFGSTKQGNGIAIDGAAQGTAEIFDPSTGRFTPTGPLPPIDRAGLQARGQPGANPIPEGEPFYGSLGRPVALLDGGAVVVGFTQSWKVADISRSIRYDPASNAWSEFGDTWVFSGEPTEKFLYLDGVLNLGGSASAVLRDGRVLVAGGSGPTVVGTSPEGYPSLDTPEIAIAQFYDPATNTWSPAPTMPARQSGGQALTLADGSILVYGGSYCTRDGNYEGGECAPAGAVRFVP